LNKVSWIRYQVSSNFSVGADAQYNFGKIETSSLEFISEISMVLESNTANLSGVNFDVGAMYKAKLNSKLNVYSSVNYAFEHPNISKHKKHCDCSL
jgi:hypothetical protein